MSVVRQKWIWFAMSIIVILMAITAWKFFSTSDEKIVYVYSDACSYCTSFTPKLEKAIKEYSQWQVERLDILTMDGYEKAMAMGAESTPTVFFVKDGQVVDKIEGDVPEVALTKFFEKQVLNHS